MRTFTVTGPAVELGGEEIAVLASTTCGGPIIHEPRQRQPQPAQAPTPVKGSAPVTG